MNITATTLIGYLIQGRACCLDCTPPSDVLDALQASTLSSMDLAPAQVLTIRCHNCTELLTDADALA